MKLQNILYVLTCLVFSIVIGAAVYEHVAVWPNAFAAPPKSLHMFQGEYPLHTAPFWMSVHPVGLIFFFTTIAVNWKTARRKNVLIPLMGYLVVLISTAIFFVPTLLHLTGLKYSVTIDPEMQSLAKLWVNLSLLRLAFLIGLSIILFLGLTKPAEKLIKVKAKNKTAQKADLSYS
jgi:hypothetical protein